MNQSIEPSGTRRAIRPGPLIALVGLGYLGILILQTARTMYLDANSIADSQFDLAGYALVAGLGIPLLYFAVQHGLLRFQTIVFAAIFLFLLVLNIRANWSDQLFPTVASRYGILVWFLLGMGAGLSLYVLRATLISGEAMWFGAAVTFALYIFLIPVAFIVANYLQERVETESYQQVSSNAIILICTALLTVAAADAGRSGTKIAAYILLILSTFLVYAIVLMQSTSIVAFWLVTLPVALLSITGQSKRVVRVVAIAGGIVIAYWIVVSFLLGDVLKDTRFGMMNENITELSSIQSRLSLLSGFWDQFSVAPLFGAFDAELRAGYFEGNYVHSLPLSLLTHTGIVGFLLITLAIVQIIRSGRRSGEFSASLGQFEYRLFLIMLLLGSLFTFFTWMPFWFLFGMISVKAAPRPQTGSSL